MKHLALAGMFAALCTSASAQSSDFRVLNKDVVCAPLTKVLEVLLDSRVAELPVWRGNEEDNKSEFVLLINEKNDTWTMIQYYKDYACVLGIGKRSQMFSNPPR